jgi:hypothetical protein
MKALEWQRFLLQQRDDHGKTIFTTTELANAAGSRGRSLGVALQRLADRGVIARYAAGRYGLPDAVRAEDLVPAVDSSAYITAMYALYRHHVVTQSPTEITCFTNRRHNRSRVRETPVGRLVFVCVAASLYAPPDDGAVAPPEQALADFVFVARRRGVAARDLVTFRNLDRLDRERLRVLLPRYPETVQREVARLLAEASQSHRSMPT